MISPNVLITRDFDTMQRVFFGPSNMEGNKPNLSDRLESIKNDRNTLLCAPGTNNSLIELDFNLPQGSQSQSYINAKFVESNEIIEYFLLQSSPLETQFNTIYSLFAKAGIQLNESLGKLNKFYIAFGTGDDMNEWAGPFVCTLGTANMVLDNNVKVLTLGFVCGELTSIRSYTQKLYGNLGFENEKLNPALPKDARFRFKFPEPLKYGLSPTKGPRRDPSAKANTKRVFSPPFSWNPFIRSLLQGYIGKVYGGDLEREYPGRVMVLLSEDFDEIINKDLEETESADFLRNYESKLKKMGISLTGRHPNVPLSEQQASFIGNQEGGQSLLKYYTEYYKHQGDSQAIREKAMEEYKKLIDPKTSELIKGNLSMEASLDIDPDEKLPDRVLDPIYRFIGALKGHTGSIKNYCIYELNDSEIISLLDKAMKNGGMGYPGGGPGTPRIIFGDTKLIKKLIYLSDEGEADLKSSFGKLFTLPVLDKMDWEGYREDFKSIILARERTQNSSFKEQIDFGPFNPVFQEIKNEKDIIFLHGVKNSNVLSISFQKDLVQGPLLDLNVKARQRGAFTNSFNKKAIKNDDFKVADLIKYFEDKKVFGEDSTIDSATIHKFLISMSTEEAASLSAIEAKTGTNLLAKGRFGTASDLDTYVSLIVGYHQLQEQYSGDRPDVEINYLSDNNTDNPRAYQTMADIQEKMSKLVVSLNIKTLPFFNQKFYFEKECYLFSMYNNVITTTNDAKENPPSTFLNGGYLITGARHFMSAKEAFSEFELTKTKPENDPLSPKTEKAVKDAAPPPQEKKEISKPITPNPGGERFPDRPATGESPEQNKLKRQQIAQQKRKESTISGDTTAVIRSGPGFAFLEYSFRTSPQGEYSIGAPPAVTQERQDLIENNLKAQVDKRYARVEKGVKNPDATVQRKLERRDKALWLRAKKNYDAFMLTKKNNNGIIPTYNVDDPPLR